ncbi:MAG: T9SS type A sorting domain-containing protein [Candidatus Kapaibacterium sp.]|jgi:hypothetical protein|nr:T9SS type A sorting domain-containing protein [Candidatus Kapabacteria bacterium]
MTKYLLSIIASIFIFTAASSQTPRNVDSRDFAILLTAKTNPSPPSITINWTENELAAQYRIYRKKISDDNFAQNPIATLEGTVTEYTDVTVEPGVVYEYEVSAVSLGLYGGSQFNFIGYGYIACGVNIREFDNPGYVLLIIEEESAESLTSEIIRLKDDLRAEGWGVIERRVARTETFDGEAVKSVKQIVYDERNEYGTDLKTIFLFGRVAVPYSGDINPDAHPDHKGAWPADIYYGHLMEQIWSDNSVNNSTAKRAANHNVPADGKFDLSTLNYDSELSVGRVDMYGMKLFHGESEEPEVMLLKRYLDKNHSYRNGEFDYRNSGIVDDNFNASGNLESFASSGWRNIASLVGGDNVKKSDLFTTLSSESCLFAYGCGPGSYTSAGGIGTTSDFATKPFNAVFTMLFGSYFGDWDIDNNLLRAPLASEQMSLTCAWSGRPQWYFHHLNLGYPFAYSVLKSQNNLSTYKPNVVFTQQFPNGVIYSVGMRGVHAGFMGDPTLRLKPYEIPKPMNISTYLAVDERHKSIVKLTWNKPAGSSDYKFNIYRSTTEYGMYKKLNDTPIDGDEYEDVFDLVDFTGTVYYMVRTVADVTNNAGTHSDVSRGVVTNIAVTNVEDAKEFDELISVYPNPIKSRAFIEINLSKSSYVKAEILDLNSNVVCEIFDDFLSVGTHTFNWDLSNKSNEQVPNGVYFVRVLKGNRVSTKLISVVN